MAKDVPEKQQPHLAPVPPEAPPQLPPEEEERLLSTLIRGELPAPNEFAAYLIDRINIVRQQREAAGRAVSQLREELRKAELAYEGLGHQNNGYVDDLRAWNRKLGGTSPAK